MAPEKILVRRWEGQTRYQATPEEIATIFPTKLMEYDTEAYPFRSLVAKYLEAENLESVGIELEEFTETSDTRSPYHKKFYAAIDHPDGRGQAFKDLYRKFVAEVIAPLFPREDLVYQTLPTFRIHPPGNICTHEFHKDTDYQHLAAEENFHLPVTDAVDTSAIWMETEYEKADYVPMEVRYGQFSHFKGSLLTHGTMTNTTGATRVSFDFRALPLKNFKSCGQLSMTTGRPLAIGSYFSMLES